MLLINNNENLSEICQELSLEKVISIDTEFLRRYTYFSKLSLIQIVTNNHKIIIDTLSNIDLSPLETIFLDDKILKLFHAPMQDFEIFYRLFKYLPKNVFDTQIAANICGLGKSLSYSELCKQFCGVDIDKTYQKANWLQRPLKQAMLEYAIKDAQYLEPIYIALEKILTENNLWDNYRQDITALLNPKIYTINFRKAWRKVKFTDHSESFIYKMQIIAAFGEECAAQVNLPRRHFITDNDLIKLCHFLPTDEKNLSKLKLDSKWLIKYKTKLFDLCMGLKEQI